MQVGFQKNITEKRDLVVPQEFTNAICFGQTGSGKTSSFILPNIDDRIESNHSLIIYDFKGNLHLQIKQLAQKHNRLDDVVEIGKFWGRKINVIKHCSLSTISSIYNMIHGNDSEPYWQNASRELLANTYLLLQSLIELKKLIPKKICTDGIDKILTKRKTTSLSLVNLILF